MNTPFAPRPDDGAMPRAGRLVMVDIEGTRLDDGQARFLRTHGIRAVCLFRRNLGSDDEIRRLTRDLRDAMGPGALIGIDQEGGSVIRATTVPQAPAAMALGAAGDEALARTVGAAVSRGVRSLGFNWNFAPVLDVNSNPDNPVIAERSFGGDPHAVARLAGAWLDGALSEGIACCVKHFPGHGDTHVDSHHGAPVVDKPLAALQALELLPFHALRHAAPAMMTAHIVYPQLDPQVPATLSRRILGELLRGQWGYDGVVITDSLVMQAIHARFGHERAAVMTLQAGADMAMALGSRHDQEAALRAIDAGVREGRLSAAAMRRSEARLDALAQRFPAQATPYPAKARDTDEALMQCAWAQGLCTVGEARRPPAGSALRVFAQREVPCDGVSEAGLSGEQVRRVFHGLGEVELVLAERLHELRWPEPAPGVFDILVSNARERFGDAARAWRPDLHLAVWNPFQVLDVAAPAVVTWGYAPGALHACHRWLLGEAEATGRLPVPLHLPSRPMESR